MEIRASSFNLGRTCPGSVVLAFQAKQESINTDNEYTLVGTAGHKWLELRITQGKEVARAFLDTLAYDDLKYAIHDFWPWFEKAELVPSHVVNGDPSIITRTEYPVSFMVGEVPVVGTTDLLQIQDNHAWVIDWKFYNNTSLLKPIGEDMQMLSYALGSAESDPMIDSVTIHRVLCYQRKVDTLTLDVEGLEFAKEAVADEAKQIWDNQDRFNIGAQCQYCFHRERCDTWKAQEKNIQTKEVAPYQGGDFEKESDVLRFLLAVPVIRSRLNEGIEAAKRLVMSKGQDIVDLTSKQQWGTRTAVRDNIVDPSACLQELVLKTSQEAALGAAKTSKKAMEDVMKAAKVPPKDRRAFIEGLREKGLIEKKEGAERWEWRKIR